MKKAMFITAVTAFSAMAGVIIARLMYFYAAYDSPAEVFSFILKKLRISIDIFSLLKFLKA